MKKIFNIVLVFTVFFIIIIALNKCELGVLKDHNDKSSKTTVADIPEDAPLVLIDAGHGFKDPGCESQYLSAKESEITLIMAKLLKEELESKKIRVILTHHGKSFPKCNEITKKAKKYNISYDVARFEENNVFSAYERAIYANVINAQSPIDLFISIHVNSIENNEKISQYEIYYHKQNPCAEKLKNLSQSISARLDNYTKILALSSDEAYTVTRYSDFPALLLETGYATNKEDAKKLNNAIWRKDFCKALAEEIENWISE